MNKQGKTSPWLVLFGIVVVVVLIAAVYVMYSISQHPTSPGAPGSIVNPATTGCSQNPSIGYAYTNALTGLSATVAASNFKDKTTGLLLGSDASKFSANQVVTPLINGSGYITKIAPDYTVLCGNQLMQGSVYQFQNETVQLYDSTNVKLIGGTLGSTANDTKFTTQANNKLVLTGNTYKSSSKMFVVFEISNTANVSSVTLNPIGGSPAATSASVPNCYSNTLSGTPFRAAFEIPAIVGGQQVQYNVNTVSASGNTVQGAAYLTVYNEQDGLDSLTGALLTSGICDSGNKFFGVGGTFAASGAGSSGTAIGITNSYYYL